MKRFVPILLLSFVTAFAFSQAISLTYEHPNLTDSKQVLVDIYGNQVSVTAAKLDFIDGSGNQYVTICADLTVDQGHGSQDYNGQSTDPTGSAAIDAAGRIVADNWSIATNSDQQEALQLAVWSVLYNGGATFNANGSNFSVVSGADATCLSEAATYYQAANTTIGTSTWYKGVSPQAQSQLTPQAVPSPLGLVAFGVALMTLVVKRRSA